MLRFVPPAGAPLSVADAFAGLREAFSNDRQGEEQVAVVASRFDVRYAFGTSSGRAGLWLILKALHRLRPDRNVVALPAYTCFSVPASVVRAGLRIHPVDIDLQTLDFDVSQLESLPAEQSLCVIGCNLFGFPNDFETIRAAAEAKGAYVIDDAAQALGTMRDGRFAGTFGDVGLYSLGRGKALGTIKGGVIVTKSEEVRSAIDEEVKALPSSPRHKGRLMMEMLGYSLFQKPHLFWIPNSMSFLKLGTTEFEPSFPVGRLDPLSSAILPRQLLQLDEWNRIRLTNAEMIARRLSDVSALAFPEPSTHSRPTFIRLPVLAPDKLSRDRVVSRLRAAGIGASAFYPSAICDIPGIQAHMAAPECHCGNAEMLSQRLFTLPVHPFVTGQDVDRMVRILGADSNRIPSMASGPGREDPMGKPTKSSGRRDRTASQDGVPRVSVVIPAYNAARRLGEAVESVLAQTYTDYEVIVVNDGSKDDTEHVARRFGDRVVYVHQENQGAGAARNTGIKKSRGEYIAFLDADDLWFPDKLAQQVPLLEQDAELGLVYSDWELICENGAIEHSYLSKLPAASGYVFDELLQSGFILTSGVVVRRACLDDVGDFDNSLSIAQDYDLWLRIAYRWKIALVNQTLLSKRNWDGSLSSNLQKTAVERIALFEGMLAKVGDMPSRSRRLIRRQLALNYWDVGYQYFDQFLFKQARRQFLSSLSYQWTSGRALRYLAASCLPPSAARAVRGAKRMISWA
jgi:perosamine synthetase